MWRLQEKSTGVDEASVSKMRVWTLPKDHWHSESEQKNKDMLRNQADLVKKGAFSSL